MTLIAAFRCDVEGRPGVVVCADSQESAGDYRVTVEKIKPRMDVGSYELIVGGSGYIGALIDGQADVIERYVKRWSAGIDEEEARVDIERALMSYHSRQVRTYADDPSIPDYKVMSFIICVRDKTTSQIYLWKTFSTTARRVEDYALAGWEDVAYQHVVEWLYYKGMPASQAVLLGMYLFTVAENSRYIGPPIQVIVVSDIRTRVQPTEDTHVASVRVKAFNRALARLVLACPDTGLHQDKFKELIFKFAEEAMHMREYHILQAAALSIERALADPDHHGDVIPPIPPGMNVAVHTEDPALKARMQEVSEKTRERLKQRREREQARQSDTETSEGQP